MSREIRPPVERLSLRRQPDGHRPTAAAGQHLDCVHVYGVDIRPLFSVDLDGDVVFVQVPRNLLVVEGLLFHHVAPVAGGVADREQNRATELLGGLEGLVAPGVPVEWVMGMLAKIGARLQEEAIGVFR